MSFCLKIFGIIENMSGYICPKCGHTSDIFGVGGANKMSNETGIEVLGIVLINYYNYYNERVIVLYQ